ncbi:MAG: type II secretion system F family protein [Bacillota bacterium]
MYDLQMAFAQSLPVMAVLLTALAVFWAVVGNKINRGARLVRLKDETVETRISPGRSSQDVIIITAGGITSAGIIFAVTGAWHFALLGLFGGTFILKWWKRKQEEDRMELLKSQFVDVLGQLESAMYGGLNPYQALEDAVPNMPRPARDVFYEVLRRTRTGDTLVQALEAIRKETGWEELKALSVGMRLYSRVGCDLGEICRHSMESHEDRESFRSIVSASIAQNIMTLKVLTVLPFFFVGLARVLAPGFARPLFHTVEGSIVFIMAAAWIILGNILTRKMIKKTLGV